MGVEEVKVQVQVEAGDPPAQKTPVGFIFMKANRRFLRFRTRPDQIQVQFCVGTWSRFPLIRFFSSTNTRSGFQPAFSSASSTSANAAMITRSPNCARRAADPFSEIIPLPRSPLMAYVVRRSPLFTF